MKTIVVIYTGNGNSRYVYDQLNLENAEFHYVNEFKQNRYIIPADTERIGLITPVYNGGLPYPMFEFIKEALSRRDNFNLQYLFGVMTYSNRLGSGLYALDRTLMELGLNLAFSAAVKMPETNLRKHHKPLSEMETLAFANKELNAMKKIGQRINQSEIKLVHPRPFGRLSVRISKAKNMPHPFPYFTVNNKCNGCEICLKVCPMNNLKMNNGKPVLLASCIECFACYNRCPQNAIKYKKIPTQYKGLIPTEELMKK